MQDENIFKMSEMADTQIKDIPTLNILICYLLYKINIPVGVEDMYDITVGTGLANYFSYQDSIDYLLKNGLVKIDTDRNDKSFFTLLPKGTACAKELKNYAPKSYRDKLVLIALRYFARIKSEKEMIIRYIELDRGCYIHIRCPDNKCDLMDLKLFAPDIRQAKIIGEKIMMNPAGFYGKIIQLALSNEEVDYDLSDN